MITGSVLTCLMLLQSIDNNNNTKGSICLKPDGSIQIEGDMKLDDGAKQFWEYVKQNINKDVICKDIGR